MAEDIFQKALDQIAFHEAEARRLKLWVNQGDEMLGNSPRFSDVGSIEGVLAQRPVGARPYNPGEFFNKPFAAAVKVILNDRYVAAGNSPSPASVDQIHEALMQGTFNFETAGADNQKNSIRISLGKNSVTFVKLPGTDLFGLVEWYGSKPRGFGYRRRNPVPEIQVAPEQVSEGGSENTPSSPQ